MVVSMMKLVDTNDDAMATTKMGASSPLAVKEKESSRHPCSSFSSSAVVPVATTTTSCNNIVNIVQDEMRDDDPIMTITREVENDTKRIDGGGGGSSNNDNNDDEGRSCVVTPASSSSSTSTILSDIELSLLPYNNDNDNDRDEESSLITTHPDLPVDMISPSWTKNPDQSFFDGGESIGSLTLCTYDEGSLVEANCNNVMHVNPKKEYETREEKGGGREYKKEMKEKGREFKKQSTPRASSRRTLSMKNIFQRGGIKKNMVEVEKNGAPATPSKVSSEGSGGSSSNKLTPKTVAPPTDKTNFIHHDTNESSVEQIPITACDVDKTFSTSTDALFANVISMGFISNGENDAATTAAANNIHRTNTINDEEDCSVVTTFINDISTVGKVKMNEFVDSINKLITVAIPAADDDLGDTTKALVRSSTNAITTDLTPIQEVGENENVNVKLLPRDVFGRIIKTETEIMGHVSTTTTQVVGKRDVVPVELLPRDVFGRIIKANMEVVSDVSADTAANITTTIAAITSLVTVLDLPKSADKMLAMYKGQEEELLSNLKTMLAKQIDADTSKADENAATIAEITSLIMELSLPKSVDEMLTEYKGREDNLLKNLKLIKDKQQVADSGQHNVQSQVTPVKDVVVEGVVSPTNLQESKIEKPKPAAPKARRIKSNSMKKLFMSVGLIKNPSKSKVTGTALVSKSKVAEVRVSEETVKEDKTATIAEITSLVKVLSLPKSADKMLEKYKGREEDLLTNLKKMKANHAEDDKPNAGENDATIAEILSLIEELSLPKSGDKILSEYKGREDNLLKNLHLTATAEITSLITELSLPKSADKMLEKYRGREEELLTNLKKMKAKQAEDDISKAVPNVATIAEITSLFKELSLPKSVDEMLTHYKGREDDLLKNLKLIKANQQVADGNNGDNAFSFLLGATQDILGQIKDGLQGKDQENVAEDDAAAKMQEVGDDYTLDDTHYSSVVPTTRDIFGRFNYVEVGSEVDTPSRWPLLENLLLAEVSSASRENIIVPIIIKSDEAILENKFEETVMMEEAESTSQESLVPPVESQVHQPTSNPATATVVGMKQIASSDLSNDSNKKLTIESQPRKKFFSDRSKNKSLSQKSVTCPPPRSLDLEDESNKVKMIVNSIMRELKDEDVHKDNTMTEDELSLDNQTIQNSIDTNNQTGMLNKASFEVSQSSWPTFFTASVKTEQPTQQFFIPVSADVIDVTEERADRSANVSTDTVDLKERLESDSAESNIELSLIEEAVEGGEREKSEKKKNKFKLRLFEQSSVRDESEHIIEYHELKDLSPVGAELANGIVKKAEDPIFNMLSVVTDKMSQPSSVSPVSKLLLYTDLDPLITKAAPAEKVAPIKTVKDFSFRSPRSGTLRKEDEGLEKSLKDDDKTPKMGRVRTFDKPFSKRFVFDTVNSVYSADSIFESGTDQDAFDQEFGMRGKQEHYANSKEDKKKLKKLSEDVKNDEPSNVDSCESNIELSLVEDEDGMDAPVEEEEICKRPKFNRWGKRIKKTKASMKDKKRTNHEPKGFASASDNKNAIFKPSIRELQKNLSPISNDVINSNRNSHSIKLTEVPYVASPTASKSGTKKKLLRIETKSTDSEPITKSKRKKRKVGKKQPYPAISETFSSELYDSIDSDDPLDYITDFFCCGDDTL